MKFLGFSENFNFILNELTFVDAIHEYLCSISIAYSVRMISTITVKIDFEISVKKSLNQMELKL